ncbi:class I SAM-dependent methyltransferase [Nonomuraea sp. NPDC050556]|uniref:class I SAM-dependent methyltransferase n=1 Tax=Nonomuraea sp. NPDC050556 TaxID=3364369 RepID=UPI00379D5CDA
MVRDVWEVGEAYEAYVGRWSRRVAVEFLRRLSVPAGRTWLDVGCGTGALTQAILAEASPARVVGVDPAEGFLATARGAVGDARAEFRVGDAQALPLADDGFEAVVSGLALNFVPDHVLAVGEMVRVAAPGAVVAAYVWDYAEGMEMMRHFWDAAIAAAPDDSGLDESVRFPVCRPGALRDLWVGAGVLDVVVGPIDVPTVFSGFDDFWDPFLGGQGAAPAYAMSLTSARRADLRERLRGSLPYAADGTIPLTARAWAVSGTAS